PAPEAKTNPPPRTAPQASTAPETRPASLSPFLPALPHELFEPVHFAAAEDLRIHHPAHQLFNGPPAKPIDNLPHRMRRQTPRIRRPPRGKINVSPPLLLMPQIPLLLQPPQQRPHRR